MAVSRRVIIIKFGPPVRKESRGAAAAAATYITRRYLGEKEEERGTTLAAAGWRAGCRGCEIGARSVKIQRDGGREGESGRGF